MSVNSIGRRVRAWVAITICIVVALGFGTAAAAIWLAEQSDLVTSLGVIATAYFLGALIIWLGFARRPGRMKAQLTDASAAHQLLNAFLTGYRATSRRR